VEINSFDLHGLKHQQASKDLENFILTTELPARVITGNSVVMINILKELCQKHNLQTEVENYYNLGSYIVKE
jgi:DNA-nicking Smr family endonuclease